MVFKFKKGIISFLTILILIQLSDELNVKKENFIINIRQLQSIFNDTIKPIRPIQPIQQTLFLQMFINQVVYQQVELLL